MPAALFDCDGVLVDSYTPHYRAWARVAAERGFDFPEAEYAAGFGKSSGPFFADHYPEKGLPPDAVAEIDRRKERFYREAVEAEFPVLAGTVDLARRLHDAGWAIGIGTAGPRENAELAAAKTGLAAIAGAVVSADDVARSKPAPDIYLQAAQTLGIAPHDCVVFEDSKTGIAAARAAGMTVVAIASTGHTVEEYTDAAPDLVTTDAGVLTVEDVFGLLTIRHDPPHGLSAS
ncbi:MAG: HAD family phosphatase [Planctomycetota bacterium]